MLDVLYIESNVRVFAKPFLIEPRNSGENPVAAASQLDFGIRAEMTNWLSSTILTTAGVDEANNDQ